MNYNVIGDIPGQYQTLLALLEQMPKDAIPVSLGDMTDRGPDSDLVVEFFKKNGKAVLGNHEHMMMDFYRKPNIDRGYGTKMDHSWTYNGGGKTLLSYINKSALLKEHLEWLETLPSYIEDDNFLLSHAPLNPYIEFEKALDLNPCNQDSIIWNRDDTLTRKPKIQIYGHNARYKEHSDEQGIFAYCIDNV